MQLNINMENKPKFLNIIEFYDTHIEFIKSLGFYTLSYLVEAKYLIRVCKITRYGKICQYLPNKIKLKKDFHYIEEDGIYYYNVDFLIWILRGQKEYIRRNGGG